MGVPDAWSIKVSCDNAELDGRLDDDGVIVSVSMVEAVGVWRA